ncbi:MAG: helicase RepA family protein [Oscillospiraceae bacterium]|nr:helicase RepA family protein [Oscillospiraceae bacterium]
MTLNNKIPKILSTIDGNTLMAQTFEPLKFTVKKILPHGLFILAGSPKIGKSWLALDLCQSVATGSKLWNFSTEKSNVLYLALEDTYNRLQNRLRQMEAESLDISHLHLAITSFGLQNGLLDQINNFLLMNPSTNLIAIDTLEHIRNSRQDKNLYACDYRDMSWLREITNSHPLTILLVHHTRKMYDQDPLNTISGSTGLIGAVDGVFVLEKIDRIENEAKLTISNRDTESFCFNLRFDSKKCRWIFIGNDIGSGSDEDIIFVQLDNFLQDEWSGTATELASELKKQDDSFNLNPAIMVKRLNAKKDIFKNEYLIDIQFVRTHSCKRILLKRNNI